MKCFQHRETDAVAICRSCGRALCSNCIVQIDTHGVVCSVPCKLAARRQAVIHEAIVYNLLANFRTYKSVSVLFKLFGGICLLAAAAELLFQASLPWPASAAVGTFFLLLAGLFFVGVHFLSQVIGQLEQFVSEVTETQQTGRSRGGEESPNRYSSSPHRCGDHKACQEGARNSQEGGHQHQ